MALACGGGSGGEGGEGGEGDEVACDYEAMRRHRQSGTATSDTTRKQGGRLVATRLGGDGAGSSGSAR